MNNFFTLAENFIKQIEEMERQRKKISEILRELNGKIELSFPEKFLFKRVEEDPLEKLKVAGVDGGLAKESLHGIDLIFIKAIGVVFEFEKGKLKEVCYHPKPWPSPTLNLVFDPFSELEFEMNSNMQRQISEVEIACETLEKFKPDLLLMDGSIIPHYVYKPESSSPLFQIYQHMIDTYKKLFSLVSERKTILAGIIEDSRGTRFCEILVKELGDLPKMREARILLEKTKDTNLLSYVLENKERTFSFPYSSEPATHPILREFDDFSSKIQSFYLKAAQFDRPIRIDFFCDSNVSEMSDKISSVILSTCNNSAYSFPSVLIEADLRVRFSTKEAEDYLTYLKNKLANLPAMFELRRKKRPF
ncbi:MAG: DNA double-strand break repair nuclease NurA [Candidatus Aenigmatarchaeota archaeon]